jgi:polygalacturonase
MSYDQYRVADFGASKAGLLTVGYTLDAGRITAGIEEVAPGAYGATVTIEDDYAGPIVWDSGEGTPAYVAGAINPDASIAGEVILAPNGLDQALDAPNAIGGGSLREAVRALAAAMAGDIVETLNADGSLATTTIKDFKDPAEVRITAASTSTSRVIEVAD